MSKVDVLMDKIKNDRRWYMEHFLKIRNKDAEIVPFKLNYAQDILMKHIEEDEKKGKPKRYVLLKARQLRACPLSLRDIFTITPQLMKM